MSAGIDAVETAPREASRPRTGMPFSINSRTSKERTIRGYSEVQYERPLQAQLRPGSMGNLFKNPPR